MQSIKFLNSKEKGNILKILNAQFGFEKGLDYIFWLDNLLSLKSYIGDNSVITWPEFEESRLQNGQIC